MEEFRAETESSRLNMVSLLCLAISGEVLGAVRKTKRGPGASIVEITGL